jgi:hypothetical protein
MTKTHSSWVAREAAKHVTSASIRQRINHEQKQILILDGIAVGGRVAQARHAHAQLIQVLTQRLVGA